MQVLHIGQQRASAEDRKAKPKGLQLDHAKVLLRTG